MNTETALKNLGRLVLSYHDINAGGRPIGPYTMEAILPGGMARLKDVDTPHPVAKLVLNETYPVDFDDPQDPDCPTTAGAAVMSALSHLGLPEVADGPVADGDAVVLIWDKDSASRIRQRLNAMGWEVKRTRPWKK